MIELTPTLHDAAIAGVTGAVSVVITAALPRINQLLEKLRPDAQRVYKIIATMDLLLQDRVSTTIGGLDVLDIAKESAMQVAAFQGLTEDRIYQLAAKAASRWDFRLFREKISE